ncbi:hypothetical protein CLOP_g23622 [Closterium sp. NIES-67]|nr:hypothetical protein CLOP_g23622 [Closterium sp. NIES-67]
MDAGGAVFFVPQRPYVVLGSSLYPKVSFLVPSHRPSPLPPPPPPHTDVPAFPSPSIPFSRMPPLPVSIRRMERIGE